MAHFATENSINQLAKNNRSTLIATVFYFVNPVEKDGYKHNKMSQNSVSFSNQ